MNPPSVDPSAIIGIAVGYLVVVVAIYVWVALALSRVFSKSGVEGWKAWVPFLNTYVLLELGGFSGWFVLLGFVPVANIVLAVVLIMAYYRINVAFGHGVGMTVLAAFVFPVWASIIGFGSARWVGRESVSPAGPSRTASPFGAGSPQGGFTGAPQPSGSPSAFPAAPPAFGGAPRPAPAFGGASAAFPAAPAYPGQPAGASGEAPVPPVIPPAPGWTPRPSTAAPTFPPAPGAGPIASAPLTPGPVPAEEAAPAPFGAPPAPPAPVLSVPPVPEAPTAPEDAAPGPSRTSRSAAPEGDDAEPWAQDSAPSRWPLPDAGELSDPVTAAVPGAPEPVSAVAPRAASPDDEASSQPPVTRVPARSDAGQREPWAPSLSPSPDSDAFPEASGPVSAIAGAPDAGAPRSARASVSAQHTLPHVPDEEEDIFDATVVTRRKRSPWTLVPASGGSVAVTGEVVILGRRPVADPAFPGAQLVALDDDTRTVSKTHARLHLREDTWTIVDLGSTNGVLLTDATGAENEVAPNIEVVASDRFLLGDAVIRLERTDA